MEVSEDGRFLFVLDVDGAASLGDLTQIPRGADPSAETICSLSADQMRPFQSGLRENPGERLAAATIGRPWNPCDGHGPM